jgi:outer membrane protein
LQLVIILDADLATRENTLISATAAYAKDRAALLQLLSTTLDRYNTSITYAAAGTVTQAPLIPGLSAPKSEAPPQPLSNTSSPPPSK